MVREDRVWPEQYMFTIFPKAFLDFNRKMDWIGVIRISFNSEIDVSDGI